MSRESVKISKAFIYDLFIVSSEQKTRLQQKSMTFVICVFIIFQPFS